jgi:hypothetical protein
LWAFRFAWVRFGALGTLMSRAAVVDADRGGVFHRRTVFVALLSGLYFTSVDPLYRQRFFKPLIADVAVSLAGRDRYLEMEADSDRAR